jgi:hypothetical protein
MNTALLKLVRVRMSKTGERPADAVRAIRAMSPEEAMALYGAELQLREPPQEAGDLADEGEGPP